MDLLPVLERLGLPGWLMSIAAVIIILHYTGVIKWTTDRLADRQEHSQSSEDRQRNYAALQESWREDRLATLLEETESFIREQVFKQLEEIGKTQYRFEMTLSQYRAVMEVNGREIYALTKQGRAIETKLTMLIDLWTDGKVLDEEGNDGD